MNFEYLPDVATADIAFKAWGDSLNELFENCALAVADTMMDLKTIKALKTVSFELENENLEELLHAFLEEQIFYKDAENLFFKEFKVEISELKNGSNKSSDKYVLNGSMKGQGINNNMDFKNDIKAITMHMLEIIKKDKYYATVVVDI